MNTWHATIKKMRGYFLRPQSEKFIITEISPRGIFRTILSLDHERRVRLVSREKHSELPPISEDGHLVFVGDPSFARSVSLPFISERENPDSPITPTELNRLVSEAAGKMLFEAKRKASEAIHTDDLEITPLTSKITGFRLDGHMVLDPVGFRGRTVEGTLEIMFVVKELALAVRQVAGQRRFHFMETGRAELSVLKKIEDLPVRFCSLEGEFPYLYSLDMEGREMVLKRIRLPLASDAALAVIRDKFAVREGTAKSVFDTYMKRDMSPRLVRTFQITFSPHLVALSAAFKKLRVRGRVYVNGGGVLPCILPKKLGGVELVEPPLHALLTRHALGVDMGEWDVPESEIFSRLAPLLAYYGDKGDHGADHWLRRFLKWNEPRAS